MRWLVPEDGMPGDISDAYDWPADRWVRACMVMGLDGSIAGPDGLSGSISSPTDRGVLAAIRRGVPVLDRRIEDALVDIADDSYDTVVLSRTLQTMLRPEFVLAQMARVAERLVVSVPNFGWYRNRLRLLGGRMPVSKEIPYLWYNSPNLRFTTLADLEDLFDQLHLIVDRRFTYTEHGRRLRMYGQSANLMASAAVYVLRPAR